MTLRAPGTHRSLAAAAGMDAPTLDAPLPSGSVEVPLPVTDGTTGPAQVPALEGTPGADAEPRTRRTRPDPYPKPPSAVGSLDDDEFDLSAQADDDTKAPLTRSLLEWGAVILGALAVALLIKTFLVQAYYIPSESMVPTLNKNDRVLVNKLSFRLGDIERGQVVVFHRPEDWSGTDDDLIKRVIAVGGETISIIDGEVYIGDRQLEEPYLVDGVTTTGFVDQTNCIEPTPNSCTIPEGFIFVMGDNREFSSDSRRNGPFDADNVVGRAFVKVWPLSDFSGL